MKLGNFGFGMKPSTSESELNPFAAGIDLTNIDKYLEYVGKAIEDASTT